MPKNLLILVILFISCSEINAQKIVFDLNGRMNFTQNGEHTSSYDLQGYMSVSLNDSTEIRTYREVAIETTRKYWLRNGYEINGLFTIALSDRFSVRTGLGLNFWAYNIGSSGEFTYGDVIRVDTVPKPINENFPGGSSSCDCFENSYSDVSSGFDRDIRQEIIHLSMPFELGYAIIPGKLNIKAGMFFQTPLYAAAKQDYIDLEMTTIDDTTKCKYVLGTFKNTATTGISNFQWGVSSWISYQLFPKLQVEIGVRKHVNDMYGKEEYQGIINDNNSFIPLTFSAGLSYRLYNGIPEN